MKVHTAVAIAASMQAEEFSVFVLSAEVEAQTWCHSELGQSARLKTIATSMLFERNALRFWGNVDLAGNARIAIGYNTRSFCSEARASRTCWDQSTSSFNETFG